MAQLLFVGRSMSNKKKNVDRISLLPDSLLHDILSSLNTKQVVQTCILSKRWKTVWTRIPTLNFKYKSYPFKGSTRHSELKARSFHQFIPTVLSKHCCSHMIKLSYSARNLINENQKPLLESLICYAASHMVQELRISIDSVDDFDWTSSLSACQLLNVLKFSCSLGCGKEEEEDEEEEEEEDEEDDDEEEEVSVNDGCDEGEVLMLPFLRTLKIGNFCWDRLQEKLFLGCPNLESLVLVNFSCHGHATICAPKLENFEIHSPGPSNSVQLVLRTPNLRCVKFDAFIPTMNSSLDFPLLYKVTIAENFDGYLRKDGRQIVELLKVFHNAKSITMPLSVTQALLSIPTANLSFHHLRHLKLEASKTCKRINLPLPMNQLQYLFKCPTLETMEIDLIIQGKVQEKLSSLLPTPDSQLTQDDRKEAFLEAAGGVRPDGSVPGLDSYGTRLYADVPRPQRNEASTSYGLSPTEQQLREEVQQIHTEMEDMLNNFDARVAAIQADVQAQVAAALAAFFGPRDPGSSSLAPPPPPPPALPQ